MEVAALHHEAEGFARLPLAGEVVRNISEVRRFFRRNPRPIHCIEGRQIVPALGSTTRDMRTRSAGEPSCNRRSRRSWPSATWGRVECLPRGHYRNQWWVPDPEIGVLLGSGIYGQVLYVNMFANVVVAKLSSQPRPFDGASSADVLRACSAISAALSLTA